MRSTRLTLEQAVIRAALAHLEAADPPPEGWTGTWKGIGIDGEHGYSVALQRYVEGTEFALVEATRAFRDHDLADVADTHGRWVEGSPETSQAAALSVVRGALGRKIIGLIRTAHYRGAIGSTDDAMEATLNRSHQSLSSARNALCHAGWLMDSGMTRLTRAKRPATVWTLTPAAIKKLNEEQEEG